VSGALFFKTGTTSKGGSGAIVLRTGVAANGVSGSVSIVTGTGTAPGSVTMQAGASTSNQLVLTSTTGAWAQTGDISIQSNGGAAALSLGATGAVSVTSTGVIGITTSSATQEAVSILATAAMSSTFAGATVRVTGAMFVNNGIGVGRYTASGSYTESPVLRMFTQGSVPMFPTLCDSNDSAGTWNNGAAAGGQTDCPFGAFFNTGISGGHVDCAYKAGCYQHLVATHTNAVSTLYGNDQHKVLVHPPDIFTSAASGTTSPAITSGDPVSGAGNADWPLAFIGSAKVVTDGSQHNLYVMIKIYNLRQWSASNVFPTYTINAANSKFSYLVITHRCHGNTGHATTTCLSAIE